MSPRFFAGGLAALALTLGLAACKSSTTILFDGATIVVNGDQVFGGDLVIDIGDTMDIDEAGSTGAITITVNGDFVCRGRILIADSPMTLTLVVTGHAVMACPIFFPPDGTPPTVVDLQVSSWEVGIGFTVVGGTFKPPDGTPPD